MKISGWRIWIMFYPSAFLLESAGPQDLNMHPCVCKPKTWCNAPLSPKFWMENLVSIFKYNHKHVILDYLNICKSGIIFFK
jgi:hypothetical protein